MTGTGIPTMQINDQISRLSRADERLFDEFKPNAKLGGNAIHANFEDSYEYIRLYFDTGEWTGYRYYDGERLIYFALSGDAPKPRAVRYKIFKPMGAESVGKLKALTASLGQTTAANISLVCMPKDLAREFRNCRKKQFRYLIFDMDPMKGLAGTNWKNVRQKINGFERTYGSVRIERLDSSNARKVVHFVSAWRRTALHDRKFSYAQTDKAAFAARFYADKVDDENIWAYVYFVSGTVAAFHMLYRIGPDAAANPIGLADVSLGGLAEFAQYHAWLKASESGIRYINDGPSWRPSLERFKRKFNPVAEQLVLECYLRGAEATAV